MGEPDGVGGRSARVGDESKLRDVAPSRERCAILKMEACSSPFFDNPDAVMDWGMVILASNDASRAMRGGRETTAYIAHLTCLACAAMTSDPSGSETPAPRFPVVLPSSRPHAGNGENQAKRCATHWLVDLE